MKRTTRAGFTLIELLVVITIIGLLVGGVIFSVQDARAQARDAQRQSDLRTVQSALELYKNRFGRYPEQCSSGSAWSGQPNAQYACNDGSNRYIIGDPSDDRAFVPDFMTSLPIDPVLNGTNSGFMYTTNTDGTVYKLMVKNTVETETITFEHEYKSCDVGDPNQGWVSCSVSSVRPAINLALDRCDAGSCDRTSAAGNNKPAQCRPTSSQFQSSYAVWGGFADDTSATQVELQTESVICDR